MAEGKRRNVWLPDELYTSVVLGAAKETLETGQNVTASEWIRRAIEERVAKTKT